MKWIGIGLGLVIVVAVGAWWYDGHRAESELLKQPVYQVLKKHERTLFDEIVAEYKVYQRDEEKRAAPRHPRRHRHRVVPVRLPLGQPRSLEAFELADQRVVPGAAGDDLGAPVTRDEVVSGGADHLLDAPWRALVEVELERQERVRQDPALVERVVPGAGDEGVRAGASTLIQPMTSEWAPVSNLERCSEVVTTARARPSSRR